MIRNVFGFVVMFFVITVCYSQGVGINNNNNPPHNSAMLDISSNGKGLLIPRMTTSQRVNIQNPASGLMVYDDTKNSFYYFTGSVWEPILAGKLSYIVDNDNDTGIKAEENSDEDILKFYVRDTLVMKAEGKRIVINSPGMSMFIGNDAGLEDNGTANQNLFIGHLAGKNTEDGDKNVYLGNLSGNENIPGSNNTYIGWASGSNGTGNNNTYVGKETGGQTNGNGNVFIGHKAGFNVNVNNELRIHNGPANTPLLHGRFDSLYLTVNGTLKIGDEYSLPDTLGQVGQILKVNANNQLVWMPDAYFDNDSDPNNEIQSLTKSGNTIMLSNGGGSVIDAVNDGDFSPTNELQTLSVLGNQLSISSGNTISLPTVNGSFIEDDDVEFWVYHNNTDKSAYLAFNNTQYFDNAPYFFKERFFQIKHPNNSLVIGNTVIGGTQNTEDVIAIGNNNNFISGNRSVHIGNFTTSSNQGVSGKNTIIGHFANGHFNNVGYETVAIGDSACYNGARQSVFIGNQAGVGTDNSTKNHNVAIGYRAGASLQSHANTLIGFEAGENITTGSSNIGIGYSALHGTSGNVTGNYNIGIGRFAVSNVGSGERNIGIGYSSLQDVTSSGNIAVGSFAQRQNETGIGNIAVGDSTLRDNIFGNHNIGIGQSAGLKIRANRNIAIGTRALHSFLGNDSQLTNNIAIGFQAMENTVEGSLGLGFNNIALGNNALRLNDHGEQNVIIGHFASENNLGDNCTVIGYNAGRTAKDQDDNTLIGAWAGNSLDFFTSTSSNNTIIGAHAARNLAGGLNNTIIGEDCVRNGSNGPDNNVVIGSNALYTTPNPGDENTIIGYSACFNSGNTSSSVVIGTRAGHDSNSLTNSVVIGKDASDNTNSLNNSIVIGYEAVSGGFNSVRLGNNNITSIGGFANWSNVSDARIKTNVVENVPGLSFINLLRPVTYQLDHDMIRNINGQDSNTPSVDIIHHIGFIAQEVEEAAESLQFDFNVVVKPTLDDGLYGLRYASFTVPLVKAVQELSRENEQLKEKLNILEEKLNEILEKDSTTSVPDQKLRH